MTRRRPIVVAAAAIAALSLALTACGGENTEETSDGGGSGAAYNAGVGKVYNPSDTKGGTLRFANNADWDSLDPADTYYGYSWNFIRYYGRSLTMFDPKPGDAGKKLVPDLAESLGVPSADGKTWTYKIRKGVKFDDGTPVTSKDVKYGVERSLDKETFPNGPTYFNDILDIGDYTSPYKDSDPEKLGLTAIETPDDQTIVFKLKAPFGGFDYLAMLPATIPVPRAKDDGTKYKTHVVSTGPYKITEYQSGKGFNLVRNENWDPKLDPSRKALPDKIEVKVKQSAADIDNKLLSGDVDIAVSGTGFEANTQARVLGSPDLKKNMDAADLARTWFTQINGDVAPLDNIHCRKAVILAADHQGYQSAFGGPPGGEIATNVTPPLIPGAEKFDLYDFAGHPTGDVEAAKKELQECGKPDGFAVNISYRSERPKEKATAESLQQALGRVGIKLTAKPYPQDDYGKLYAGKPAFAKQNKLGLMIYGWGADWPDGFGFLQQIVDSRVIRAAGNSNYGVKVPAVDKKIDEALATTDTTAREKIWPQIDRLVMESAYILPGVWARSQLYRPPNLTNVFVGEGFQMYDYLNIGVKK